MNVFNRRHFLAMGGASLATGCGERSIGNRPYYSADAHPSDYPTVLAVEEMARLLRERTDGRLDIKIFAGAQLGSERDTLEITTFGGLDFNRVNMAPLNSIEPMTAIPSLPFLFRSTEHMRSALDGAPGQEILDSLEPHGLIGLCYYDSGQRSFYNTRKPIYEPGDLQGMKIRVQNSDLYVAMVRALGADATPMAFGEVYQALLQGVIDGAENNWPSYESTRHFEAAKYYSLTRHVMAPEMLVMARHRWERTSSADKELILETARESVPFMRRLWDARVESSRAKVLAGSVEVNEVSDLAPFVERMRPVWDRFITTDKQKRVVRMIEEMAV